MLAIIGGWLGAMRVPLDADTNALIGADRPFMQRYQAFLDEFGDLEEMIVVIDPLAPGDAAGARARAAVLDAHAELNQLVQDGQLEWVHRGVDAREQWRVAPHAMNEVELQEFARAQPSAALVEARTDDAILEALAAMSAPVADRAAVGSALLTMETLVPPLADTPEERSPGTEVQEEFLRSRGGRLWFLQAMPRKDFGNFNAIAGPLASVRRSLDAVQQRHPSVEIGLTGKPVLQEDELATSNADMGRASLLSLGVITVLFIWLFRGLRRPLLAVAAFGVAVGITMGLAWLLVGRITLLSSVFLLVLVGAGLDYGVHVVSRFNEYLAGSTRREAARRTIQDAGPGTLSGACATAVVFALAMATDFGGLRELGALACMGLVTSAVVMVTVLPALLVLFGGEPGAPPRTTALWLRMPPPLAILVTAIAIVAAAIVAPAALRFDANLLSMQAPGLESVAWEQRVLDDDATQTWFAASTAPSAVEALELKSKLERLPRVAKVRSAFDVVRMPTPGSDRARGELAASIPTPSSANRVAAAGDPTLAIGSAITAQTARRIAAGLERLTVLAEAAGETEGVPLLRSLAARWMVCAEGLGDPARSDAMRATILERGARGAAALAAIREGCMVSLRDALPTAIRAASISPTGSWLLQVVPAGDAWDEPTLREFVAQVRTVDPAVTGVPVTQVESIADMRRAFEFVSWLSLAAILVIAWIDFGSLRTALLATATVVAGVLLMLGLLGPLGLSLNLANFFAVPMLLGLGIDSAIHVLHRWKRDPSGLPATLTATAFTGVTTAVGFGALVLADHRGLASLGWAMLVGSVACVMVAVITLPALLRWRAS